MKLATTTISLLALSLTAIVAKAQDTPTAAPTSTTTSVTNTNQDCSIYSGCLDCVSANCAWAIGTCFASCDSLNAVECYSTSSTSVGFSTPNEVCDLQQAQAMDAATCGIQTSCEDCTSTSMSGYMDESTGNSTTCYWYEERQMCSHLPTDSQGEASPYCPNSPEGECFYNADTCTDCLGTTVSTGDTCVWSEGKCHLNCLADGSCFDLSSGDIESVCEEADNYDADLETCSSPTDCTSCIETTKSDGTSCEWYTDNATSPSLRSYVGTCGVGGCNANGVCGTTTCPVDSTVTCSAVANMATTELTCEACLQEGCAWTGFSCLEDCSQIADAPCYEESPTDSIPDTCMVADTSAADTQTCGSVTSGCDECVSTFKSDATQTCQWYYDSISQTGYCGTGDACDMNGICPTLDCSASGTTGSGTCATAFNCLACISNTACAWNTRTGTGGICETETDCGVAPGDVCYSVNSFPSLTNSDICTSANNGVVPNADGVVDITGGSGAVTNTVASTSTSLVLLVTLMAQYL